jgi:hypothetical protein
MDIWKNCIKKRYDLNEPLQDICDYYNKTTNRNMKFNSFKSSLSTHYHDKNRHHIV